MAEGKNNKPKQRHRLLVSPKELGLTARIKKALIEQDMGITQRIKKAFNKTQDANSFFYMKRNHFIMIGSLLFLCVVFGYLAFRFRKIDIVITYPDESTASAKATLPPWGMSTNVELSPYRRQVKIQRIDIYGSDLGDNDFTVTDKNGKPVENPRFLYPGNYEFVVNKKGYKKTKHSLKVGDVTVIFPVALEPLVPKKESLYSILMIHFLRPEIFNLMMYGL